MANWPEVIRQIDKQYPFLAKIGVHTDCSSSPDTIPALLKLSIATAVSAHRSSEYKLAMVLPRLNIAPVWLAVGTVLSALKSGFSASVAALPSLEPGTRVLVDGKHVVIFEGETKTGYRIKHKGSLEIQSNKSKHIMTTLSMLMMTFIFELKHIARFYNPLPHTTSGQI